VRINLDRLTFEKHGADLAVLVGPRAPTLI